MRSARHGVRRSSAYVGVLLAGSVSIAVARANVVRAGDLPNDARERFCSLILQRWMREDPLGYVIIAAGADTIPATVHRHRGFRLGYPADTRPLAPTPGVVIHGQQARILRSVGLRDSALATHSDAVVVAWGNDSMCSRAVPYRALSLPVGTVALLVAVPRLDTIAPPGVVVLDLDVETRFYAPALEREAVPRRWWRLWQRPKVLSLEEYEFLLRSLPVRSEWESAPTRALKTLEAWAGANPTLARREPARSILRGARQEVEYRSSQGSRDST